MSANVQPEPRLREYAPGDEHSLARSVVLHLLPGALGVTFLYLTVGPIESLGFPPSFAFLLAVVCVIIPCELGYLLYRGRTRSGRTTLAGVVRYREPMSARAYLVLVPALFAWAFLVFLVWSPFQPGVAEALFSWLPEFVGDPWGLERGIAYARSAVIVTVVLHVLINGLVGPVVEELYFRGYLLPGIARLGSWAPVLNTILFALYHFWTPWQLLARFVGLLPLVYTVFRRRNIYLAMIVHCSLNTVGAILMLPRILTAGG